jgi:pyruvate dehydrogenase E1 component alpha subunit
MATGMALAFKMKKQTHAAVCFVGDGAVNEGAFHEGVNMGAVWALPVVYVIENNLYAASTPTFEMVRVKKLSDRAACYGIPGVTIDGNDVVGVFETAQETLKRARSGQGPTLVECMTYRITGHSRRDPCHYQPEDERKSAIQQEPIARFRNHLLADQLASEGELDAIGRDIDAEIEEAVRSAMAAPDPAPEDALNDLYV